MKNILILGIGPSQVDLIKKCRKRDMKIYAVAHKDSGPGKSFVDEFAQIDIKDYDAVEAYAREKEIDLVFTVASEVGVKTTAIVSERLGLPTFISSESADILSKKSKWREHLGEIEGNLAFMSGGNVSDFEKWSNYPSILKPVDGSGQRGVYKINSYEELEKYFSESIKFSNSNTVMVEEYVDGPEISVNSFMQDSALKFFLVSDRISYSEYPGGIIKEHRIPSSLMNPTLETKIRNLVENVNKKTGFNNGHIYFQLKVENNTPKLIEYTPRFDGCHMWRLIKEGTGVDLIEMSLDVLMGIEDSDQIKNNHDIDGTFVLKFISEKPGETFDKNNYQIIDTPIYLEWYYEDGNIVNTVTGHIEKVGYYITWEK